MFQYLLTFLLINSCYRSLGNPAPKHQFKSISFPLTSLAKQCENTFLSNAINNKSNECAEFAPHNFKSIRCYMFYDINQQLCAAVGASQLALTKDISDKVSAEQDIDTVCSLAKGWIFTNITGYESFKNQTELLLKSSAICGEICGVEDIVHAVNDYCKYYKWGIELLKSPVPTASTISSNNFNKIIVDPPVIPEPDSNANSDKVAVSNNPEVSEAGNTKALDMQIKTIETAVPKSTPEKNVDNADLAIQKSTAQTTSTRQTANQESGPTGAKNDEADANALEHPIISNLNTNEQTNKVTVTKESKQGGGESDPGLLPETGKDTLSLDSKDNDLDKADSNDAEYTGNEGDEADGDDQGFEINEQRNQVPPVKSKVIASHNSDSQKEFYPNTLSDSFSEDGDHFFPFFLTAVILVVLLYVLYHNKSKVSKVFFGLILEGRQGGRRRNSRGHAYRRLDTLEQAMSATTAAPPSKIIY